MCYISLQRPLCICNRPITPRGIFKTLSIVNDRTFLQKSQWLTLIICVKKCIRGFLQDSKCTSDATSIPKYPSQPNFEDGWTGSHSVQIVASRSNCKKVKEEFVFLGAYFSEDELFSYFSTILTCSIEFCLPSHIQIIEVILQSEESQKQPPEVFFEKKGLPKNFAKFTGKHLFYSFFFKNVAGEFLKCKMCLAILGRYALKEVKRQNECFKCVLWQPIKERVSLGGNKPVGFQCQLNDQCLCGWNIGLTIYPILCRQSF